MPDSSRPGLYYGYVIAIVSFVIIFIATGLFYSFGVFLKPVLVEFGWTRAMTAGAFSLSLVFGGLLEMVTGRFTDRFGPRLVLTACGFMMGAGIMLMSQVNAVWHLYLFYGVVFGIGLSGTFIPLLSTVARWFRARRGMMTGLVGTGIGSGVFTFPLLVDWLIGSYGWRTAAMVIGIASLVIVMLCAQFLRRDPEGRVARDEAEQPSGKRMPADEGPPFSVAVRSRSLWMMWGVYLCAGLVIYTMLSHIVIYATGLNLPDRSAALVLSIIGAVSMSGRFLSGFISDRIGVRTTLIIGLSAMTTAMLSLLAIREIWVLYFFAVVFGFSYGSALALQPLVVAETFGLRAHGALYGLVDSGANVGGIVGPVLAGYIFDTTGDYRLAFIILGVGSLTGLILTVVLKTAHRR
ncbi:MAG: MFS transporter [Chloroflexi bacterium]|nr:MFS transporter [Chloroflexota bacterium]